MSRRAIPVDEQMIAWAQSAPIAEAERIVRLMSAVIKGRNGSVAPKEPRKPRTKAAEGTQA